MCILFHVVSLNTKGNINNIIWLCVMEYWFFGVVNFVCAINEHEAKTVCD